MWFLFTSFFLDSYLCKLKAFNSALQNKALHPYDWMMELGEWIQLKTTCLLEWEEVILVLMWEYKGLVKANPFIPTEGWPCQYFQSSFLINLVSFRIWVAESIHCWVCQVLTRNKTSGTIPVSAETFVTVTDQCYVRWCDQDLTRSNCD